MGSSFGLNTSELRRSRQALRFRERQVGRVRSGQHGTHTIPQRHWSRRALAPGAKRVSDISSNGLRAGRLQICATAPIDSFPATPHFSTMSRHGHLAHVPSYRDNPIVFITSCTHDRKQILAQTRCHEILREIWERSSSRDGWWIGHYIVMPDHVHFFARPEIDATPMASGFRCGRESVPGRSPKPWVFPLRSGNLSTSIVI